MKTSRVAIGLVVFCTFLTSLGQLFWKLGSDKLDWNFIALISNWQILLGFVFYGMSLAVLVLALKRGELSVIYPFISLSFIWVSLIALFLLGEQMNFFNWIGVGSIIAGVSFIGWGAE